MDFVFSMKICLAVSLVPVAGHPQNDLKDLKHGNERDAKVERQGSANVAEEGKSGGPDMNLNSSIGHSTKFYSS